MEPKAMPATRISSPSRVQREKRRFSLLPQLSASLLLFGIGWSFLSPLAQSASAQSPSPPGSASPPPNTACLEHHSPTEPNIVTYDTISQTNLTVPSLWWAKEQFDRSGRLITNWTAYRNDCLVDLEVNRQLWSLFDYIERYSFVHKFGSVARDYKYNLRVFERQADSQAEPLATYICDYSVEPVECKLQITDSLGQRGSDSQP